MEFITSIQRKVEWRYLALLLVSLLSQPNLQAQSVPVYATTISSQDNVDNGGNAVDGSLATRARVRASSGVLLGIGAYSGHVELEFPTTLPANTTSFVKINTDDNLLPSLLGGSLGGLLSNVLGTVLIGNQEFTIQAKNNNTVVLQGESQIANDFASPQLRLVVNAANEYFIAVTPSQAYNRIRLTNRVGSLIGLNNTKRLDVYEAFYIGTPDTCGGGSYTSFDGSGLNLDLLGLGGAGVTNPHFAIDSNPNNFSRLSLGVLAATASIEQTIYFDGASQPTDQYFIKLRINPSLLTLGVANNIQIIGYNGTNLVQADNLNSLLSLDLLTLLQGNQITSIPFSPNASVNRVTVRYNSLLNVQLTQSLDLYGITRAPARPVITDMFTLNPVICSGSTASLVAETGAGTELNWYAQSTGGTVLATTASGQPFITGILTEDTSFYVSAKKTGCPEESSRIPVAVTVIHLPVAADILIPDSFNACNGNITLAPSSSIGGALFRYYKDQQKTQEITTGFLGDAGVTYQKDNNTGALTISGLTAVNSHYVYYISLTANGLCENDISMLKPVTVNYSSSLILNVLPVISDCGRVSLRDAIVNLDNSGDIQYNFFDGLNNPITAEAAINIATSGIYFIEAVSLSGSCSSTVQQVSVIVNPEPTLTIPNTNIVVNLGTSVTLEATSDTAIVWYDSDGNALASNTFGPFTTAGFYTFTALASNGNCSATGNVFVTVIDPNNCPPLTQRVYANTQSWSAVITGGVSNPNLAIDGNPQTFSTITTGIGLLGIGTTLQTLQWNQTIAAGTPVTIKLGSAYSTLVVAGAYSVIGTKRNALGVPVDIGVIQPVFSSLANLLPGENSFEFTFVPSDNTGPKIYDGVRIIVGSLLSVSQNVKVYEAWYDNTVGQVACGTGDVEDVFSGAVDLGIGVATTTVAVEDPFNSVDGNINTYAAMYSGAGILAAADLTVSFRTPTLPGDSLEIILSKPATVLTLNLLSGFTIQMYMGNTPVTPELDNTSTLLNLSLLTGENYALIVHPQTQMYDRVKIRFGGIATVLDQLRIHEISRSADTSVTGADGTNTINVCQNQTIGLNIVPEDCTTYIWYDAQTGGNVISTGTSYTVPATLPTGTYTYYIQPVRFGCETYERGPITIIVGQTAPPTAITTITLNGATETTFCNETVIALAAALDTTATITNPIFYWYASEGMTQVLVPNENGATLTLTGLAPGSYTYYVGISSDEYCPTLEADRDSVTFTILPFSQPTDISIEDVLICQSAVNAVLTPTTTQMNPQFTYYFANDNTQPIVSGSTVDGIAYVIAPNGVLTVTGLTLANSPYTYYVGLTSDATCLNQNGDLKPVTITVNDSGTPTTNNTTQDFCLANNPTVGDIQVNEPSIDFYDAATNGNIIPDDTALVNGATYYAAFDTTTGCGSSTRLAITVTINDAGTPTTNNSTQNFCAINNPTVANLQVNEPDVTFYLAPTGGMALLPTDQLVNGTIYFASLTDIANGCESAIRLAIEVIINDAETPTTNSSTQNFCLSDNPTIADIQVNEADVIFYNTPTGGTPLLATDALVNGATYYAATVLDGCESSVRLVITTNINDATVPTTNNATQAFCLSNSPMVADISVNEPNVNWYLAATGGTPIALTEALVNGVIYYGSVTDPVSGCESSERLAVTVSVNDLSIPTTNNASQSFCLSGAPTVANIEVNETNVVFYNAATGGTQLASTDVLIDGATYYATLFDAATGCESSVRLAIMVTINDSGTPTTNDDTQEFCVVSNPTVADLQTNESNVIWFDVAVGGTALAPTIALTNGATYYASFDANSNCISSTRLSVTVTIKDVAIPTTNNTTQDFCLNQNPTVADIQVNETGVIWYDAPTNGNVIPSTAQLTAGIYYAALADPVVGCESAVRLVVTVTFLSEEPATITSSDNDQTCAYEQVTYTTQAGMENYVWLFSQNSNTDPIIIAGGGTNDNFITIEWSALGTAFVNLFYTNTCGSISSSVYGVMVETCSDLTIEKTVSNPTPIIGSDVVFTIAVNNAGSGLFYNLQINETMPSGYEFTNVDPAPGTTFDQQSGTWTIPVLHAGERVELKITVTVLPTGEYTNTVTIINSNPEDSDLLNNTATATSIPLCLTVYNEFSPNNDGANDTFRIDCIENYPNNELNVYNRYGALIYTKGGYANDWDGTTNVSGAINKEDKLPTGTYYYTLDLGVGETLSGWLSIIR